MQIRTQRIQKSDTSLFENIAPEVFDEPVRPDRLQAYLDQPNHLLLVAIEELGDGQTLMVGQCAAVIHHHPDKPDELYIDEVGTASTHRRIGIGRRMTKAMFDWGRERGCTESWLGTESDNIPARGLYDELFDNGEEMVYYEIDLDDD